MVWCGVVLLVLMVYSVCVCVCVCVSVCVCMCVCSNWIHSISKYDFRTGKLIVDSTVSLEGLYEEAVYFQVQSLIQTLQKRKKIDLSRSGLLKRLLHTNYCKSLNLSCILTLHRV